MLGFSPLAGAPLAAFSAGGTTVPYTHFRLDVTANNGNTEGLISLNELYLYENGGPDVSAWATPRSGVASASSTFGGYPASDAFQAIMPPVTLGWVNNGGASGWIQWADDNPIDVRGVALAPRPGELARAPKDFTIEYSDDGATWSVARTLTNQTGWTDLRSRVFTVPPSGAHRYWRVNVSANNGDGYLGIATVGLATADGPMVSTRRNGGLMRASGEYDGRFYVHNVLDRVDTYWVSTSTPGAWWLEATIARPMVLTGFGLKCIETARMPRDFTISGSNDNGATWTLLQSYTGETGWAAGETRNYQLVIPPFAATVGTAAATSAATGAAQGIIYAPTVGTAAATSAALAAAPSEIQTTGTAAATSTATGAMFATGTIATVGQATMLGTATAVPDGSRATIGTAAATSTADAVTAALGTIATVGTSIGVGDTAGGFMGTGVISCTGSSDAFGTASGDGTGRLESVGSSQGTGTAVAEGSYAPSPTVGRAAGISDALARSTAAYLFAGTSSGRGEALGVFAGVRGVVASAQGRGNALGITDSTFPTAGIGQATSAATGATAAFQLMIGAAAASSSADGATVGLTPTAGRAEATSAATARSVRFLLTTGTASAASTAQAIARALAPAIGSATCASTSVGVSQALRSMTGTAAGTSAGDGRTIGDTGLVGVSRGIGLATANGVRVGHFASSNRVHIVEPRVKTRLVPPDPPSSRVHVVAPRDRVVVVQPRSRAVVAA